MKARFLIILLSFLSTTVNIQASVAQFDADSIYSVVDEMPEFKGGVIALNKFFAQRLLYPKALVEYGIKAKVYVRFVIDENGNVSQAKVVRTTTEASTISAEVLNKNILPVFEQEALAFIQALPPWNAGRKSGKLVKVWTTIPVVFSPSN